MNIINFVKKWFTIQEPVKPQPFSNLKKKPAYVVREPSHYKGTIRDIRAVASKHGYTEIDLQENNKMISFRRDDIRINVYYSTMTVGTCLTHPKQGKTQLFRRNVTPDLLNMLFEKPRTHTGIGYKQKGL